MQPLPSVEPQSYQNMPQPNNGPMHVWQVRPPFHAQDDHNGNVFPDQAQQTGPWGQSEQQIYPTGNQNITGEDFGEPTAVTTQEPHRKREKKNKNKWRNQNQGFDRQGNQSGQQWLQNQYEGQWQQEFAGSGKRAGSEAAIRFAPNVPKGNKFKQRERYKSEGY
jgi:hypothetical protein